MPANSFYANNSYPTIFDYKNGMPEEGLAIIDEMNDTSTFLTHAALKPTNDGLRERFTRKGEFSHIGRVAALDEHYSASDIKLANEEKSFGTMRVFDRIQWEKFQGAEASPEAITHQRTEELQKLIKGIVKLKQKSMLYSLSAEDTDAIDVKGKKVPGLFSYVENCFSTDAIQKCHELMDDGRNPFLKTDEKLLAISNFNANRTGKDSSYKTDAGSVWTSVLAVAFGREGVLTTFPSTISANAGAGFNLDFKGDIETTDPDGKFYTYDRYNIDAYFGIGVLNRYCLSAVRNIYLGHTNKSAMYEEMEDLERNLLALKYFFGRGETGYNLEFYCNQRLLNQMEAYQLEKGGKVQFVSNNDRNFNGISPVTMPNTLQIASGITLYSDVCFKTSESYVSGTVGKSDVYTA